MNDIKECPCCEEEFAKQLEMDEGTDFTVSSDIPMVKVCVFHVHDGKWVFLHLDDVVLDEEVPDGEPDLDNFIKDLERVTQDGSNQ